MADALHIQAPDGSLVEFPAGTSDDVIKNVMAKEYGKPKESPSVAGDVAKSGGIGLAKGAIGLAGLPGDLSNALAKGSQYASDYIAQKLGGDKGPEATGPLLPTSGGIQKAIEGQTGEFYKPKTTAGEYAQTAGEFAPAMLGGPESIAAKLLTRVAAPAAASETAGQLTKDTALEPWARVASGLLGGVASPKGFEYANGLLQGGADGISRGATKPLVKALGIDGPDAVKAQMTRLGPDAMLADAGDSFLGKAQGVMGVDEGRAALAKALRSRNEGTVARIGGDVEGAVGPAHPAEGDAVAVTKNIIDHRSNIDGINYPAALDSAPDVKTAHILTQLDDMIPRSVDMERKALENLRGMLMKTERQPRMDPNTPGHQAIDSRGNPIFDEVKVSQNDAGILHKVKVALDNVIEHDQPGLGVPAGAVKMQQGTLKNMRGQLNSALEDQVPGYAEANQASSALAKRAEAVQAGTKYLGTGPETPSPARYAEEHAAKSIGEQIAQAKGSRVTIERILGTKANDLQALGNALQGEGGWNTAKIATTHGQDAADQLVATVDRNKKFRDTYQKVVEGSQTDIRKAAREEMKPDLSKETPLINPNMSMSGLPLTILKKGANAALNMVRPDPTKSYGEVARVLSAQGPQRDAHLAALVEALSRKHANSAVGKGVAKNAIASALLAEQGQGSR